jgi:hypothetical protein
MDMVLTSTQMELAIKDTGRMISSTALELSPGLMAHSTKECIALVASMALVHINGVMAQNIQVTG